MDLKELEKRLQSLLEDKLPGIFPGRALEDTLAQKIAAAIQENRLDAEDEEAVAPNVYTVILNPSAAARLQEGPLSTVLAESISTAAQEAGFRFIMAPTISVASNAALSLQEAQVVASH